MTPVILPRSDHPISRKDIDPDALKVLYRLKQAGHTAYLVGGGVRDLLLGRKPKDFDISTSAHPNDVRRLFRNCRLIGRRFRLAHILFGGGKVIEVATFRRKSEEEGGEAGDLLVRRENTFGTPEEDAERRDYTVNGLFYDIATFSVIDYVGGLRDLEERTIRTIGEPAVRLREDPVRMLRAVKFAARLDFRIAPEDEEAIRRFGGDVLRAAPERLLLEFGRLLGGGHAEKSFRLLEECGLLETLVPEVARFLQQGRERDGDPATSPSPLAAAAALWRELGGLDRVVAERKAQGRPELSQPVLLGAVLTPVVAPIIGLPALGPGRPPVPVALNRRGIGFAAGLELSQLPGVTAPPPSETFEGEDEAIPGEPIGLSSAASAPLAEVETAAVERVRETLVEPEEAVPPDEAPADVAGTARADHDRPDVVLEPVSTTAETVGERALRGDDTDASLDSGDEGDEADADELAASAAAAAPRGRRQLPVFGGGDPASRVGELLAAFVLRLSVPRRDTERLLQIVAAQRKMRSPGRRAASQRAFARKQYFPEALDLFEIHVRGSGAGEGHLRLWRSLAGRESPRPEARRDGRGGRDHDRRRPDQGRRDPGRPDPGRTDPGRHDQARHDQGRHDQGRHDPGRHDQGRHAGRHGGGRHDPRSPRTVASDPGREPVAAISEEISEAEEAALRRRAEADQMLREAAFQHGGRHLHGRAGLSYVAGGVLARPAGRSEGDREPEADPRRRRRRRRGGSGRGGNRPQES